MAFNRANGRGDRPQVGRFEKVSRRGKRRRLVGNILRRKIRRRTRGRKGSEEATAWRGFVGFFKEAGSRWERKLWREAAKRRGIGVRLVERVRGVLAGGRERGVGGEVEVGPVAIVPRR